MKSALHAYVEDMAFATAHPDLTLHDALNAPRGGGDHVPEDARERIEVGMATLSDEEIDDLYLICKGQGWAE